MLIFKGVNIMQYKIEGTPLPVVTCTVNPGEELITESGAMCWMSPNMQMRTSSNGGIGKAFGRMFSGERLFQNIYGCQGGTGMIAFASSFPGSIIPFNITPEAPIIVQKSGFLACESGVELSIFFQKKLGAGFFGGEGFIMQKLSGYGLAFVEIDGAVIEYDLAPGQQIVIDTGYLAAMSATCSIDIVSVPGLKNMLFGGEGMFNTIITGPGKIYLQTMPANAIAGSLSPYFHSNK